MQFFQCSVFQKGIEDERYWLLNMYEDSNFHIDFSLCTIIIRKKKIEGGTEPVEVKVMNHKNFENLIQQCVKNQETLYIEKIFIKDLNEDFFLLNRIEGGYGFFVSENLKNVIESAECTGIEFQPIEVSYNEWLTPEGERERVYGKSF